MRLPPSIFQSLSIPSLSIRATRFLTVGMAIALLGMLPAAGAAIPQLMSNSTGLRFGDIVVGQTETLVVTLSNSGLTSVTIAGITVSNPSFAISNVALPLVVPAGQSVEMNLSFTPAALGWTSTAVQFSSDASNPRFRVEAAGTGVSSESITASPAIVSFGSVATGASSTVPIVLTNDRTWKVKLLGITATGSGFSMSGAGFPMTLGKGQSVTVNVTYTPQSVGATGGSVFVSGPALAIPLTGTGTSSSAGQLTIAPAPLNFGNVPQGTTDSMPITLSASGANVTVSSASSSSAQFVLSGATLPFTITAGQSMSFNVAFTPQNSGSVSGSLSFGSNASNSQASESLSGTGTATPYSVNLFWNSASDAVGYNVYRSTAPNGTYSKINPGLNANTEYTDGTVASGQTYYYEASSVASSGQESARSTPAVQAVIP
jgi:Abnormal spindle-like microcephaly-assoc'd, ASPM-SPD-2-Hydin